MEPSTCTAEINVLLSRSVDTLSIHDFDFDFDGCDGCDGDTKTNNHIFIGEWAEAITEIFDSPNGRSHYVTIGVSSHQGHSPSLGSPFL